MSRTIVALYDELSVAKQVIEDLVAAGFEHHKISLISNDSQNEYSHYLEKDYSPKGDAVTGKEVASFGVIVGAVAGALVGLAALMIPGIGLALVAGPLVASFAGAVAGGITGSILGILVNSGIAEDQAPYYAEGIRRGGTLISIQTDEQLRAEDIMNRYGAINIHERVNSWREAGWQGFDTDENEAKVITKEITSIPFENFSPKTSPSHTISATAPNGDEDRTELASNAFAGESRLSLDPSILANTALPKPFNEDDMV